MKECCVCAVGFRAKTRKQICCSIECRHKWEGLRPRKRTGYITWAGYRMICVGYRRIFEHRYVMEQHLGRLLDDSEVVHHRDGNRLNNELSNLEVLPSHSAHILIHRPGTWDGKSKICSGCKERKPIEQFHYDHHARDGRQGKCRQCRAVDDAARYRRSHPVLVGTHSRTRPNITAAEREGIQRDHQLGYTAREIARLHNVSRGSVYTILKQCK